MNKLILGNGNKKQIKLTAAEEELLARMQSPTARKAAAEAFNATPAEMGRAAVKAARKRR